MCEQWKIIPDFPNYAVSNFGNVKRIERDFVDSIGRKYHIDEMLIKLEKQCIGGYTQIMVRLRQYGKDYRLIVARLVAKTFIPNPNNYPQVNHKDEDSTNNNVDNLEWCTCKYNINYGESAKKRAETRKKSVDVFDLDMNYIETVQGVKEAAEKFNVHKTSVSRCCNNKVNHIKEYIFKFSNN